MSRSISVVSALVILLCPAAAAAQLVQVSSFGSNPGALDMYKYVPDGMTDDAPLVVLLHGCSQQASGMNPTGFLERFRLRRAIEICRAVERDLADGSMRGWPKELSELRVVVADLGKTITGA